ncbi:MAG: NAD(P)/FAD-dependent oxidoreductase [Acidobacteriota bacterium]
MSEATTSESSAVRDLVIVGGGPAGMSAALVASLNGLDTLLLERSPRLGGQVRWADAPVPDLLGGAAEDGNQLADRFAAHLATSRADVRLEVAVSHIELAEDAAAGTAARLELVGAAPVAARRVLLATGMAHRRLNVPGEDLANRVDSPRQVPERWREREIVVVGGGDESSSLATDLADLGARVTFLVRSRLRARPLFRDAVVAQPRVDIREGAVVKQLASDGARIRVELTSGEALSVDDGFVRIGVEPAIPSLTPAIELRSNGHVRVDEQGRTSHPHLFAAGDLVRSPGQHYIAAALAGGTLAARTVEEDLAQ